MKTTTKKEPSKMTTTNPSFDIALLTLCELAVATLVVIGYLVADAAFDIEFTYRAITGAVLGVLVTVLNYVFLTLSVNRAVNNYLELRGTREMTDEEAEKFARENSAPIQNTIKTSFIVRTFTMLAALVVAFVLDWFSPLATAIPLLAFRPLLSAIETVRMKRDAAPNPEKFIKYDDQEEKESDE